MYKKPITYVLAGGLALLALYFAAPAAVEWEWSRRYDAMNHQVAEKIGGHTYVVYSAFLENRFGLPINDLTDVAYEGRIRFTERHDPFWGAGKDYVSPVLTNPTWLDLAVIANNQIQTTGDKHHVYLEGFEIIGSSGEVAEGYLWLGS